jgi:hypothetical protein
MYPRLGLKLMWLTVVGAMLLPGQMFSGGPQTNPPPSAATVHQARKGSPPGSDETNAQFEKMSAMGRLAHEVAKARARQPQGGAGRSFRGHFTRDFTLNGEDGDGDGPAGGQAEVSIAVDATGQHIVVGFNDTRGFSLNPIGVSGFAYSDDGGATFTDGGQLPTTSNSALNGTIAGTSYPQVFGDPDVKYVPGGNGLQFIYASILVKGIGSAPNFSGTAQTLCIHRSIDGGQTWQGPFEVTAATNPTGVVSGGNARDDADKEFIDVDPDTGRVLASWSNFTSTKVIPGGVQISTAYCDNIMSGNPPVWSARSVLNSGAATFDTGSIPRFAGNSSNNVYVAWSRSSATTATSYGGWPYSNIGFARSTDNGATWSAAANLTTDFFPIDYVLGNDRVHSFPGLAVDESTGTSKGNVYVVYVNNNNRDGGDIVFQRSTNRGVSFSTPILLNSRPGADRAQWFPVVSVDADTGRINVMYDDQGIADSGDLMEMSWIYSDDGGVTWSKPTPLTTRPFHGGYGNDTGQPNLGDYNGGTARGGAFYAAFAATPELSLFTDGQPSTQFSYPSFLPGANPPGFKRATAGSVAVRLGSPTFVDSGGNGFLDPGETILVTLPLFYYATNGISGTAAYTSITATLASTNAGVQIATATQAYADLTPGSSASNASPFIVSLQPDVIPGTIIEFSLTVNTSQGSTVLRFSQPTGTPVATTIFSENFDGVSAGSLPAGWTTTHGGGNNTVPWTTSSSVPAAPDGNALFHVNANDGTGQDSTRWERVFSPSIDVPANASFVLLNFDVWFNTEDDPDFNILAYDGFFLRVADLTAGRTSRNCLAEAFAEDFVTGTRQDYPKHLPRNNNSAYFQDMSAWGGYSGGWQHVQMKLPGVAGSRLQLRWEFTQDSSGIGTDIHPGVPMAGVAVDNIVMRSVVLETNTVLVWATPTSITYGTPLDSTQLNATANIPGTFAYTPDVGRVLNAGSNLLSVIFTPTDTAQYMGATGTVGLVVLPAPLTATAQDASRTYGQTNPVFTVTLLGVTNGDNIGVGATTTAATGSPPGAYAIVPVLQDPNNRQTNYQVTLVNGTLTVLQAAAGLTWANPLSIPYGTPLSATQLNATAGTAGIFAYVPAVGTVLPAGTNQLGVVFTPTDGIDYASATGGVSVVVMPYLVYHGINMTDPDQAAADADGDGIPNLMEYALGTDPHNPADAQQGLLISSISNAGNQFLTLQYKRLISSPGLPLYYIPEVSGDQSTWFSDPSHISEISVVPLDAQFNLVTVQDLTPIAAATPRFIRLRVGEN